MDKFSAFRENGIEMTSAVDTALHYVMRLVQSCFLILGNKKFWSAGNDDNNNDDGDDDDGGKNRKK